MRDYNTIRSIFRREATLLYLYILSSYSKSHGREGNTIRCCFFTHMHTMTMLAS